MPALTDTTKADTIQRVAQAMYLAREEGMRVRDACNKAGITTHQFYRWASQAADIMNALRESFGQIYMEELAIIALNRTRVLSEVVEDALSPETLPIDRLEILKHLETRGDILLETTAPVNADLSGIMGFPHQKPGVSRFSAAQLEIEQYEDGVFIRPHPQEIIDITPEQSEAIPKLTQNSPTEEEL